MALFPPLSDAQERMTKDIYINECQQNRANAEAYCACHFDAVMSLTSASNTIKWTQEKNKAENARQSILKRLEKFSSVTPDNLRNVCDRTKGYWGTLEKIEDFKRSKKTDTTTKQKLSKSLVSEKTKADNIFLSYKKEYGMLTVSNGHTFDDYGNWVSTNEFMSYCVPLNKLHSLNEKINSSPDVPHFSSRSIYNSPDKEKCFALLKSVPQVSQDLKNANSKNDAYMKQCLVNHNSNKSTKYCECHLEVATDIAQTRNKQRMDQEYATQEYYRDIALKQLTSYKGVTEDSLQKLCHQTRDYWDIRTELFSVPRRNQNSKEAAKSMALYEVLKTKEKTVDSIFDAYKNLHGLANRSQAARMLSSNINGSYCAYVSEMGIIKNKMNETVDTPPYKPFITPLKAKKCESFK